jgi:hypothetical protein
MADYRKVNVFPRWANRLPLYILIGFVGIVLSTIFIFSYWLSPKNLEVGYAPQQPINYSHKLHAGDLGIDCRYCHNSVESQAHAGVPPIETCMNCHTHVKKDSPEIVKLHEHYVSGKPIEWVKVHQLPDYAYFNHSSHVNKGVSCVECHGRVDQMPVVHQVQPLSMSWCLECHRAPAAHIRPKDQVTNLGWTTENREKLGQELVEVYQIRPREDCNTCHR